MSFVRLFCKSTLSKARSKVQDAHFIIRHSLYASFSTRQTWSKVSSDAEKIVGYPTSFMSLRCLLSDEISNVAMHVRKLVGTNHPLLKTARGLVYDGKNSMQMRGLIVLLISKAAGVTSSPDFMLSPGQQVINGIYSGQRAVAEITEMIHTASLIHKGVVNIASVPAAVQDMQFGNKLAILGGDFLLATASTGLAELNNTQVVEIMSSAIADMMKSEFVRKITIQDLCGQYDADNISLQEWEDRTYLSSGSLLAKSCYASMKLVDHSEEAQNSAYKYGKNLAYLRQLYDDMQHFLDVKSEIEDESAYLSSAPVIMYLGNKEQGEILSLKQLDHAIRQSTTLTKCTELSRQYAVKTESAISAFPDSDAKQALLKMVSSITL